MKIYVKMPVREHHRAMLAEAAGDWQLVYSQDGEDAMETAQIVMGEIGPEDLAPAGNLQWVHTVWAGTDRFRPEHFPAGTKFTNGSGAYGVMIAEHMMACILSMLRQLPHYGQMQREHRWDRNWQEDTLEGKTVLILGAGDIGAALAKRLQGFDCRVIGIRRTGGELPYFDEVHTMEALDRLLPEADVVACVLPGTNATKGLLNGARLRAMKPAALLVNCGRGSLIVTEDLEQVLAEGHLAGCALDVMDPEPLPTDSSLWDCPRVILTPHISGASFGHMPQCEDKIFQLAAENLRRFRAGEELLNQVDFSTGYRKRNG